MTKHAGSSHDHAHPDDGRSRHRGERERRRGDEGSNRHRKRPSRFHSRSRSRSRSRDRHRRRRRSRSRSHSRGRSSGHGGGRWDRERPSQPVVSQVYDGKVTSIKEFGCFVRLEGMYVGGVGPWVGINWNHSTMYNLCVNILHFPIHI